MFGRNRQKATATVQYCEEFVPKHGENRAVAGGYLHEVILDMMPEGAPPFRATTRQAFHMFAKPKPGDVVLVTYDAKSKDPDVRIETKGDPRYDLEAMNDQKNMDNLARRDAILQGMVPPVPIGGVPASAGVPDDTDILDDQQFANSMAILQNVVNAEQQKVASLQPRARLGIGMGPAAIVENGAQVGRGLRLDQIDPGGPGAHAGLQDGDVLRVFNGVAVGMPSDVMALLTADVVNRPVPITIRRGGQDIQVTVVPAPR